MLSGCKGRIRGGSSLEYTVFDWNRVKKHSILTASDGKNAKRKITPALKSNSMRTSVAVICTFRYSCNSKTCMHPCPLCNCALNSAFDKIHIEDRDFGSFLAVTLCEIVMMCTFGQPHFQMRVRAILISPLSKYFLRNL